MSWATLRWSVRRELWENRSLYVGPSLAGCIFLAGFIASLFARPEMISQMIAASPANRAAGDAYMYAALVIMATAAVVGIFYCLDAFYGERRDRSILFWKSLPVSDAVTVASKAAVVFIVLPAITIAATLVLHLIMLTVSSVILSLRGADVAALWRVVAPGEFALRLIYHIFSIHVLWYAPIFAWVLLASAWARRAPFVWAGLPILAIVVIERLVLGTSRFLEILKLRTMGGPDMFASSSDMLGNADALALVQSCGFWIGILLAIGFLAATIRVRRNNTPV